MRALMFTVITRSRLYQARVLMQSVARAFPTAERHVLVVDPAGGCFDPAAEDFAITFGHELGLPRFTSYAFANDTLGFCCFLKPVFARFLLERTKAEVVIYADSDVYCYAAPEALLALLEESPVALTPHATGPVGSGACRSDGDLMRTGPYNAGLFACRRSPEAATFLAWWQRSMESERRLDGSIAHDQPWLSLAAVYFPWIATFRDAGYNVAYWNIQMRPLAQRPDGVLTAGGRPLSFFHFSFFSTARPDLLANRPPIVLPAEGDLLRGLLREYADRLEQAGATGCLRWPYAYGFFTDGKPVTDVHRHYFLERAWDDTDHAGEPFDPCFTTRHCRGLKAVYAVDHLRPRAVRRLNRWLRRLT
ncbi:MAG TPA: hypothetical protein VGM73_16420 [Candidatus Didemnitutus sp.]|jgi:hypothetical protein